MLKEKTTLVPIQNTFVLSAALIEFIKDKADHLIEEGSYGLFLELGFQMLITNSSQKTIIVVRRNTLGWDKKIYKVSKIDRETVSRFHMGKSFSQNVAQLIPNTKVTIPIGIIINVHDKVIDVARSLMLAILQTFKLNDQKTLSRQLRSFDLAKKVKILQQSYTINQRVKV